MAAHQRTQRRRSTKRKLIRHPDLCQCVVNHLKNGWTPEQIGNRMIFDGAKQRVCHALPDRVSRSDVPRRKPSTAISTRKKAWHRSCGGTCPCTERTARRAVPANVRSPNLTVMSAYFSARTMSPIVANLATGREI